MSKNPKKVPVAKVNPKRSNIKLKRGFGTGMIEKLKITEIEWCQKKDPLFKIKGKERYKLAKEL